MWSAQFVENTVHQKNELDNQPQVDYNKTQLEYKKPIRNNIIKYIYDEKYIYPKKKSKKDEFTTQQIVSMAIELAIKRDKGSEAIKLIKEWAGDDVEKIYSILERVRLEIFATNIEYEIMKLKNV